MIKLVNTDLFDKLAPPRSGGVELLRVSALQPGDFDELCDVCGSRSRRSQLGDDRVANVDQVAAQLLLELLGILFDLVHQIAEILYHFDRILEKRRNVECGIVQKRRDFPAQILQHNVYLLKWSCV